MLRCGQTIRLTPNELHELQVYTRADPGHIRTLSDLEKFFEDAKRRFSGDKSSPALHRAYDEKFANLKLSAGGV